MTAIQLLNAAEIGDVDIVKMMLEVNVAPGSSDSFGRTALHRAATMGHVAVVEALLEKGASTMQKDDYGRTPLESAQTKIEEAKDCTKVDTRLGERRADVAKILEKKRR
mmetsp:Transcript_152401/g.265647  ORF Transcript_152401/g.265647 Transcript_152401/m.265647 type:complete len:109 (+) Transcript_152401:95-421(+)